MPPNYSATGAIDPNAYNNNDDDEKNVSPYGYGSGSSSSDIADNLPAIAKSNWMGLQQDYYRTLNQYNIADQAATDNAEAQKRAAKQSGASDWFSSQLNLQSTANALKDSMGNGLRSSGYNTFNDLVRRVDDLRDVSVINSDKDNINAINFNLDQTLTSNNNARNAALSDTWSGLQSIIRDMAAQSNSYDSERFGNFIDEYGNINWDSDTLAWFDKDWYDNEGGMKKQATRYTELTPFRTDSDANKNYERIRESIARTATPSSSSYEQRNR